MARPLRIEFPGATYYITSGRNASLTIFKSNEDRYNFLSLLKEIIFRFKWRCHAYCLMGNHYHLIIETVNGNLSRGMRHMNGVYTLNFNRRHKRSGHVFQGRYKAVLVETGSYLKELCRHVVLNPVRVGKTKRPEQYRWSSYRVTAGFINTFPAVTTDWILNQFAENRKIAQKQYRRFVMDGIENPSPWANVKAQCLLGSKDFVEKIIPALRDRTQSPGAHKDEQNRPELDTILPPDERLSRKVRNKAIVTAHLVCGYSLSEIANRLGLHYSTISKIVKNHPHRSVISFAAQNHEGYFKDECKF